MWAAIAGVIAEILKVLFPALIEAWKKEGQPTAEVSAPNPLKDELRKKVLDSGWGKVTVPLLLCAALLVAGCAGTRTIYVPNGQPVKLRATIPQAQVWVLDESGKPTAGVMDLPEGWYCLPVEK